jgi:hypothetical protein
LDRLSNAVLYIRIRFGISDKEPHFKLEFEVTSKVIKA